MPDSTFADLTIVLDRSGSMASCAAATIAGFNSFLKEQQAVPGKATLSLHQFDHRYETVYAGIPVTEAVQLTEDTFVPRGNTRLLDAIGRTIDATIKRHEALAEDQRPGRVLIAVITDGGANTSSKYSAAQVSERIAARADSVQGSWEALSGLSSRMRDITEQAPSGFTDEERKAAGD